MHRQSTSSSEHSSGSSHYQKVIHYETTTTTSGKDGGNLSRSNSSGRLATSMMSALTTAIGIAVNTSTPPIISTSTPPPEIMQNPSIFGPVHGQVQSDVVWHYFTLRGWLTKHVPPSYSFTKSSKLRYLILADRMLYVFKNDRPTLQYREFFELTKDTQVFVSDRFTGVLYCLVISKRDGLDQKKWYLECADAETMKEWLDKLKKTVAWLKENDNINSVITLSKLSNIQSEHDALVNNHKHESSCLQVEPLSPRWLREGGRRQEGSLTTSSYFDDSCSSEEYLSGAPPSSPTSSSTMKTQLSPMTPPMHDSSMRLPQYNQYPYSSAIATCNSGDSNESLVDEHHPIRTFSTSPPFAGSRSLSALPPQRPPPRRPVPPPPSSTSSPSSPIHPVDYASSPQHFMYP
ncbi:hypothetical protein O0I10_003458 [Lichtheimia ornata]|uniref:PH domain-containing protein n=1 Tax=Lichtheimia ornata TaxID=688661 RepID=A0AAD7XZZ7_9FUNG|nr:uncharacterized protein O0I10_003458 [Lichtheimia ornata]KAJ8660815.1 hypothetical protein O0I10_003458 [Lichtheimia ornata]